MKWYLKVIRDNYANFNGRARRQEYWMFVLFNIIISIVAGILDRLIFKGPIGVLANLYGLAVLIPAIAVGVRRLHDINKSGWTMLIVLIPIIGWIWLLILFIMDSTPGENKYGPNPKENVQLENI